MYNPFSLEGKTILITGASSGIGQATAIECAKLGAKCVITGRNAERLQATFDALEGEGHMQIIADLTNEEDMQRLVNETPALDGLVNNAGIGKTLPIQFYTEELIQRVMSTNFSAPVLLIKTLLKKKKINKGGSIVFTSSIASFNQKVGNSLYGCSKAALENYAKFASRELAPKLIRCNSVHPGMVETPLIHGGGISEEQLEAYQQEYPLKRFGRAEEIAWGIIYLLSDASAWVSGHSLVIDGGITRR